ncbi:MAG: hypothetical protein GX442_00570 [Candidatus Riflebacteria bacterium]|nr:hypothetical protein [Candidatus Riflebacteria bacterium]
MRTWLRAAIRPSQDPLPPKAAKAARNGGEGRGGFTLVEAVIGLLLVAVLFALVFRIFSHINRQRALGSVDLQELQGARYAINFLRRDFRSAAPMIPKLATFAQKEKAALSPAVEAKTWTKTDSTVPIVVADSEIHFHRQLFDTPDFATTPATEEVSYHIDGARKCLVRVSAGKEIPFPEVKGARFELYGHPLRADIPMLLVSLVIEAKSKEGAGKTEDLEFVTTISSSPSNQNLHYPFWHRIFY